MTQSQAAYRLSSKEDSSFDSHDPTFEAVLGDAPRLEHVVDTDAHEGPVYVAQEDSLYFTSLPARHDVAIRRLDLGSREVTTIRAHANGANGMTLGLDGRLVVCEQGGPFGGRADHAASIARPGEAETVVDGWRGLPFNSPNDVVVHRNGSIWFTDPSYGYLQGFRPEPQVRRLRLPLRPGSRQRVVVADALRQAERPRLLARRADVLYVTDSGANQEEGSFYAERPHHIVAFDVVERARLAQRAGVRRHDARLSGRDQDRQRRTRVRVRVQRRPGLRPRR